MEYCSPDNQRFSIQTKLRVLDAPPKKPSCSSLLAYTFLLVCAIIIVHEIVSRPTKETEEHEEDGEPNHDPNSIGTITLTWAEDLKQVTNGNQVSIPLATAQQCQTASSNIKQKLEESLSNIRVFELIHSRTALNYDVLDKYFYKVSPLSGVKHPKFTSPAALSPTSFLHANWWNPFYDSNAQMYKGINNIFDNKNMGIWRSNGNYLTVVSNFALKPALIVLQTGKALKLNKNNLYLYGLLAFDCTLANRNTLEKTFIKKVQIKAGRNQIQCDRPQCATEYSMLMLVLDQINIENIQIYSRKKY